MQNKLNQSPPLNLLEVVTLLKVMPGENLNRGRVGTIVEVLNNNTFEVEFSNKEGRTITNLALNADNLMLLKFEVEAVF